MTTVKKKKTGKVAPAEAKPDRAYMLLENAAGVWEARARDLAPHAPALANILRALIVVGHDLDAGVGSPSDRRTQAEATLADLEKVGTRYLTTNRIDLAFRPDAGRGLLTIAGAVVGLDVSMGHRTQTPDIEIATSALKTRAARMFVFKANELAIKLPTLPSERAAAIRLSRRRPRWPSTKELPVSLEARHRVDPTNAPRMWKRRSRTGSQGCRIRARRKSR